MLDSKTKSDEKLKYIVEKISTIKDIYESCDTIVRAWNYANCNYSQMMNDSGVKNTIYMSFIDLSGVLKAVYATEEYSNPLTDVDAQRFIKNLIRKSSIEKNQILGFRNIIAHRDYNNMISEEEFVELIGIHVLKLRNKFREEYYDLVEETEQRNQEIF